MKKKIRRGFLLILLFIAAVAAVLFYTSYRNRRTVTYSAMASATLPVVEFDYGDLCQNVLHGYCTEPSYESIHGTITPLSDKRQLTVKIRPCGAEISQVIYQLRSLDGSDLIEDGILTGFAEDNGEMTKELQLANLMEDGREYLLILRIDLPDQTVRYYSRVIWMQDGAQDEMLNFIREFSDASFSEDPSMIINYIQPNDTMANDDLGYINIHSRYAMFTWNGLNPEVISDVKARVTELNESQMTAELIYQISIGNGELTETCNVTEKFVVRYRNSTRYLLDYERSCSSVFDFSSLQFDSGNLWLGITDRSAQTMDSPDGTIRAYVYDGVLFCFDEEENSLTQIFTFRDGDDERTTDSSLARIRPVRVGDDGSMDFLVYGYFCRGSHEGTTGLELFRYTPENRELQEAFFISSSEMEDIFETRVGDLSFVSSSGMMYFSFDGSLYSVDLNGGDTQLIVDSADLSALCMSDDRSAAAWMSGGNDADTAITAVNLESGTMFHIEPDEGKFFRLIGFIGDDLIYGSGNIGETMTNADGTETDLLEELIFVNVGEELTGEGSYLKDGIRIRDAEISGGEITVKRVIQSDGIWTETDDDQIFLTDGTEETQDSAVTVARNDDSLLALKVLEIGADEASAVAVDASSCRIPTDAEEKNFEPAEQTEIPAYRVYAGNELIGVYDSLALAVQAAYDPFGRVIAGAGTEMWHRGTRAASVFLEPPAAACSDASMMTSAALSDLINFEEGVTSADGDYPIYTADSAAEAESVLLEHFPDTLCVLSGCTVTETLYYVNQGHPVLLIPKDGSSVLLTGYQSGSVRIFDPYTLAYSDITPDEAETLYGSGNSAMYVIFDPEAEQ
ncbi:MAG: hypothetical protein ACOX8B_07570 [Lachnospiraceae bacterium]|jgi:hypothetical protein